jgi:hypothetical protein
LEVARKEVIMIGINMIVERKRRNSGGEMNNRTKKMSSINMIKMMSMKGETNVKKVKRRGK